jgi:SAF domain
MSVAHERPAQVTKRVAIPLKLRIAPEGRRRHAPWLIVGVLVVAVCAFGFGQLYLRTTGLRPVLAVASDVAAGQVVQATDLRIVDAAAEDGISLIPDSAEGTVLGQPASHDLIAGSLLTRGDVTSASNLAPGQSVVAIACKPGQYPPTLSPGDRVTVIDTGSGAGSLQGATAPPVTATVVAVDVQQGPASNGAIVSIRLPSFDAASVASTAAAGRVALVLQAPGS